MLGVMHYFLVYKKISGLLFQPKISSLFTDTSPVPRVERKV